MAETQRSFWRASDEENTQERMENRSLLFQKGVRGVLCCSQLWFLCKRLYFRRIILREDHITQLLPQIGDSLWKKRTFTDVRWFYKTMQSSFAGLTHPEHWKSSVVCSSTALQWSRWGLQWAWLPGPYHTPLAPSTDWSPVTLPRTLDSCKGPTSLPVWSERRRGRSIPTKHWPVNLNQSSWWGL